MPDDLEPSTPARLRELVAALPERAQVPWTPDETQRSSAIALGSLFAGWNVIGSSGALREAQAIIALIATVASPPVVHAVAALMEAEDTCRLADLAIESLDDDAPTETFALLGAAADRAEVHRRAAFDALDAALRRSQP